MSETGSPGADLCALVAPECSEEMTVPRGRLVLACAVARLRRRH